MHVYPFTSVLGEAALTSKSLRIKWIKDDVASIDVAWESRGHKTPDGTPIPNVRSGLLNLVSREEQKGVWKIVVGHNVDYITTYIQSDRKRAIEQKERE